MRHLFSSLVLAVALTGCGSTPTASAPVDLTGTNASIDANTAAINGLGSKLDALAPAPPAAKVDPESCTLPSGMSKTKFDDKGRLVANTGDLLADGTMLVVLCDVETAPNGWRTLIVSGLGLGSEANGQEGLAIDDHGAAVNVTDLRGMSSKASKSPRGKHFKVACNDRLDADGCKVKKVETAATSITVVLPKGAKIVTGS